MEMDTKTAEAEVPIEANVPAIENSTEEQLLKRKLFS